MTLKNTKPIISLLLTSRMRTTVLPPSHYLVIKKKSCNDILQERDMLVPKVGEVEANNFSKSWNPSFGTSFPLWQYSLRLVTHPSKYNPSQRHPYQLCFDMPPPLPLPLCMVDVPIAPMLAQCFMHTDLPKVKVGNLYPIAKPSFVSTHIMTIFHDLLFMNDHPHHLYCFVFVSCNRVITFYKVAMFMNVGRLSTNASFDKSTIKATPFNYDRCLGL